MKLKQEWSFQLFAFSMMVRNKNKHWYYLWITIVKKMAMLFSLIYQIWTDSNLSYSNLSCNWLIITASFFKFTVLCHANIDEECYISVPTPQPLPYCYKAEAEFRETSLDKHIKKLGLVRKCKATKNFECLCHHDRKKNREVTTISTIFRIIRQCMFFLMYIYQISMV